MPPGYPSFPDIESGALRHARPFLPGQVMSPGMIQQDPALAGLLGISDLRYLSLPQFISPANIPMGPRGFQSIIPMLQGFEPLANLIAGAESAIGLPRGGMAMFPLGGFRDSSGNPISQHDYYQARLGASAMADHMNFQKLAAPATVAKLDKTTMGDLLSNTITGRTLFPLVAPDLMATYSDAYSTLSPGLGVLSTPSQRAGFAAMATRTLNTAMNAPDSMMHDFKAMSGLGMNEVSRAVFLSANQGLVNRKELIETIRAAEDSDAGAMSRLRDISAGAAAMQRSANNVFGEGGSNAHKMMQLARITGAMEEGLSTNEVANRGDKIKAFADRMNTDSKAVAEYVGAMKKMIENAGIASRENSFEAAMSIAANIDYTNKNVRGGIDSQTIMGTIADAGQATGTRILRIADIAARNLSDSTNVEYLGDDGKKASVAASELKRILGSGPADDRERAIVRGAMNSRQIAEQAALMDLYSMSDDTLALGSKITGQETIQYLRPREYGSGILADRILGSRLSKFGGADRIGTLAAEWVTKFGGEGGAAALSRARFSGALSKEDREFFDALAGPDGTVEDAIERTMHMEMVMSKATGSKSVRNDAKYVNTLTDPEAIRNKRNEESASRVLHMARTSISNETASSMRGVISNMLLSGKVNANLKERIMAKLKEEDLENLDGKSPEEVARALKITSDTLMSEIPDAFGGVLSEAAKSAGFGAINKHMAMSKAIQEGQKFTFRGQTDTIENLIAANPGQEGLLAKDLVNQVVVTEGGATEGDLKEFLKTFVESTKEKADDAKDDLRKLVETLGGLLTFLNKFIQTPQ